MKKLIHSGIKDKLFIRRTFSTNNYANGMRGPPPVMGKKSATNAKEPQGILEAKLRADKTKPFNPLVICGPTMSGKTLLIEHFIFNQPDLFVFVKPYSNSLGKALQEISNRDLVEGVHFKKATIS